MAPGRLTPPMMVADNSHSNIQQLGSVKNPLRTLPYMAAVQRIIMGELKSAETQAVCLPNSETRMSDEPNRR